MLLHRDISRLACMWALLCDLEGHMSASGELPRLARVSISDQACEVLKESIFSRRLAAVERLELLDVAGDVEQLIAEMTVVLLVQAQPCEYCCCLSLVKHRFSLQSA